ncbi:MAG: LuxR C-terminal-related transcriptional regulator, partial [Dehalococcoidia bacterium]
PQKVVEYSLLAGEEALAAYAWGDAQQHFERGLVARGIPVQGDDPLPDAEAADLVFGYGRARVGTAARWQMQDAVDALARAFNYYFDTEDSDNAVAVAGYPVPMAGTRTGRKRIIQQALTLVSQGSLIEGRLLSHYGLELGRAESDYEGAQEAFYKALAVARECGSAELELNVLSQWGDVDLFQLNLAESSAKCLAAIHQSAATGGGYNEAFAHMNYARALMLQGNGVEAQAQMAHFRRMGERLRDRYWLAGSLYTDSWVNCLLGDWVQARSLAETALELAPQDANSIISLVMSEYETGNFGQGESQLQSLLETMPLSPPGARANYVLPAIAIPYAALISGTPLKLDEAVEAAHIVLSSAGACPIYIAVARSGLGMMAIIQGDASGAAEQYEGLKEIEGILVPFFWSGDWVLGLLARTMGENDRAASHFEDALVFCRKAGYLPQLARTSADYADLLLEMGNANNQEKVSSLLVESLNISTNLNMRPLLERVQSRIAQLGQPTVPTQQYPDGLSEREIQVLRLVARGRSNPEIADELVLSVRTVANHVANILNKTGTSNRTEAASYATRHGLA